MEKMNTKIINHSRDVSTLDMVESIENIIGNHRGKLCRGSSQERIYEIPGHGVIISEYSPNNKKRKVEIRKDPCGLSLFHEYDICLSFLGFNYNTVYSELMREIDDEVAKYRNIVCERTHE